MITTTCWILWIPARFVTVSTGEYERTFRLSPASTARSGCGPPCVNVIVTR